MIAWKSTVGTEPYLHEIDELTALDIDMPLDFDFAEMIYKKRLVTPAYS